MRKLIFVILTLSITSTISAEITWLYNNFPPYYILDGKNKGEGRDQQLVNLINSQLPKHHFSWKHFPISRIIAEVSNPKNNYCVISLFKNAKRKKNMYFSKHFSTLSFTQKVFMRLDSYYQLEDIQSKSTNPNINFSLNELLDKYQFGLGIARGRSYDIELDKVINNPKYKKQIFYKSGVDVSSSLLKLLDKNRVQIVLGYVEEFKYTAEKLQMKNEFIILPIDESSGHVTGYVGCSKNTWGKKVVIEIDKALHILYQNDRMKQAIKYWLPSNMHQTMEQLLTAAIQSINESKR
ncbi:MAG: TIGR02285 family protein [Colwellia sp.]|nr:TIGR02285 family protein [Colwellia sp.]